MVPAGPQGATWFYSLARGVTGHSTNGGTGAKGDVIGDYSSDKRLKQNSKNIENALDKINIMLQDPNFDCNW